MTKRNVATALWFLAGWTAGGMVAAVAGLPPLAAVVPGFIFAGLVRWDPTGFLWSDTASRGPIVRPINQFAASLERSTAGQSPREVDRAFR